MWWTDGCMTSHSPGCLLYRTLSGFLRLEWRHRPSTINSISAISVFLHSISSLFVSCSCVRSLFVVMVSWLRLLKHKIEHAWPATKSPHVFTPTSSCSDIIASKLRLTEVFLEDIFLFGLRSWRKFCIFWIKGKYFWSLIRRRPTNLMGKEFAFWFFFSVCVFYFGQQEGSKQLIMLKWLAFIWKR